MVFYMKRKAFIISIISMVLLLLIILLSVPINTNARILIKDKDNNEIAYLINANKSNLINPNEINEEYLSYILAIEDKDFYSHNGFSIKRIIKSFFSNITSNNAEGASTITQQYIKNTYLSNEKKISRKLVEIYLAIKLENKMEKNEILNEYLASIYFGHSIYGLKNAARYYYNKEIKDLSKKEMISFIALWNAPTIYSNNLEKWNKKKNQIAKILLDKRLIQSSYDEIITPIELNINTSYINSNRMFYIDQVINEFNSLSYCGKFNELITINTKYNPKTEVISKELDISYSIIGLDKTGYYTCCIGDQNYYKSSFNIAMNGIRDIGSTIKPILYYEAIKCGFENTTYISSPYSFTYKNKLTTITNSNSNYFNKINMRTALAVSDNIYAIKIHLNLGMYTLVNHLKKYNITSSPYPSLALGSVGMSLNHLARIYFQFFSEGYYIKPRFISSINGLKTVVSKEIINDISIINKIKLLLEAPFDSTIPHSTCGYLSYRLKDKCYGKSGLTDYDSYLIGFNENNLYAVWCGNINNNKLTNSTYKALPKELFIEAMNIN